MAACGTSQLRRADLPAHCERPDARTWLAAADSALPLVPYRPRNVYDVDANNRPVPFRPNALAADALAITSYPDPTRFAGGPPAFDQIAHRSFLYDNALAVLWLTHRGDFGRARRVLASVAALQRQDGAWGFGFNAGPDDSYYNAAYVRTGTVAWVTYAFAQYRVATRDSQFDAALQRAVTWLLQQRDPQTGLFYAGSGRWRDATHFEPAWPAHFFATEHAIDTWFALLAVARALPEFAKERQLAAVANTLAQGIDRHLWLPSEQRFAQGMADGRVDAESALDASGTWSALWLLARGDRVRAAQALAWVAAVHARDVHGWHGLQPYRDAPPPTWFVEGSLAASLAAQRLGQRTGGDDTWQDALALACMGGLPLVYAPDWHADFPLTPAAAPTLWFLFVGEELTGGVAPWLWTERQPAG